jgi:hypothetical protein
MKTLLINPPYPLSEVPIIPMGIAYIASVLEQNGYEVQVLDLAKGKKYEDVPGIAFRANGAIEQTAQRPHPRIRRGFPT